MGTCKHVCCTLKLKIVVIVKLVEAIAMTAVSLKIPVVLNGFFQEAPLANYSVSTLSNCAEKVNTDLEVSLLMFCYLLSRIISAHFKFVF